MKRFIFSVFLAFVISVSSFGQSTLQASIGIGTNSSRVKIYVRPVTTVTNGGVATFQFNLAIPTSTSPVPTLSIIGTPAFGSGWQIDPSYIEDGYRHYNINSAAGGVMTLGAGVELEVMELEFSGGFTVNNSTYLMTQPAGGALTGNGLFYSFGDAQSVEGQLYYNRGGVTIQNNPSYTGPLISYALLSSTLPVRFTSFNISCQGGSPVLKWVTATENNNHHFEIERSADGVNWAVLGQVPTRAAGGNSSTDLNYEYKDISGVTGGFYRIKQVDIDGRAIYSIVVKSDCGSNAGNSILVYPVPAKDQLNIRISTDKNVRTELFYYDAAGRLLKTEAVSFSRGVNYMVSDISSLPSGQYMLICNSPETGFNKKFTIVR